MADISKITLPSGTTYDIKDATARSLISDLQSYSDYLGVSSTAITDGATTSPIVINNVSTTPSKGNIVNYGSAEFIWNGSAWQEFGDLSALGDLAYKDSASGSVTAAGTVSQPTFTGTQGSVSVSGSGTVSPAASGTTTYTPSGTISQPTITITPTTTSMYSITGVGTLPTLTTSVSDETLTISFSQGTLPTRGSSTAVYTGATASSTTPTFTGTGVRLTTSTITSSGNFTPSGTVSKPTFTGSSTTVTVQ